MPYNPGFGQQLTQAGVQGALAGGKPGGPSRTQSAGEAIGTEALGAIPVVGGMLKGGVSGYRSGLSGAATGLAPGAQQALRQQGGQAQTVKPPAALSKGRKAARGVGIAALNFVPAVGPALSAGAAIANSAYERNQTKKYQGQVKAAGAGNQSRLAQMSAGTAAGRPKIASALSGLGAGGGRAGARPGVGVRPGLGGGAPGAGGAGETDMSAGVGAAGGAPQASRFGGGGLPPAAGGGAREAAATRGAGPAGGAANPQLNPSSPGYGNPNKAAAAGTGRRSAANWLGGYTNKILAEQMQRGLDPRILSGLQGSATQAAAGTRQTMNDALARSGDTSGYGAAIQGGTEMALQNQMAAIPSQFASQQQDYLNDLIFKTRGTRPGTSAPSNQGQNWGATLQGIGSLAQGAGSLYTALK